jgi:outer membrane protein OmpA-like peptidoglycan-associated protein
MRLFGFLGLFIAFYGNSQNTIYLANASFEDLPRHSRAPAGWTDCGFVGETPPDIQPNSTFKVTKKPKDGTTYLGMVVRENDTWEGVGQRLQEPLKKGQCYNFSIYLARSEMYVSLSRMEESREVNYVTPARLRIYGGFEYCDKDYLLGETAEIVNSAWMRFDFKFEPIRDYTHLVLEAFYKTPTLIPYNGNLLLDHASPIVPTPCETQLVNEQLIQSSYKAQDTIVKNVLAAETSAQPTKRETPTVKLLPAPNNKEITSDQLSEVTVSQLKEGQTIRINSLFFEMDKSMITPDSKHTLEEIFSFMHKNKSVVVEIGGHTNGLCSDVYCDELSGERAKSVAVYLTSKGIPKDRVQFKGYGKRQPIATNETPEGRMQNQRVELKIISLGN